MSSASSSSLLSSWRHFATPVHSRSTPFATPRTGMIQFSKKQQFRSLKCFTLLQHRDSIATPIDTPINNTPIVENEEAVKFMEAAKRGNLAGAGIVADSVPEDEQQECENKAAALARAIDLAESAFVKKSES